MTGWVILVDQPKDFANADTPHKVIMTSEYLARPKLYEHALPELEDELNRCARKADYQPEAEFRLLVCFGIASDARFEAFGRLLFDWFRCPALEITVDPGTWLSIDRIRPRTITRLANGDSTCFHQP